MVRLKAKVGEDVGVSGGCPTRTVQNHQGAGVQCLARPQSIFLETAQLSMGKGSSPGRLQREEFRFKGSSFGETRLTHPPASVQAYLQDAQVVATISRRILAREPSFSPGKGTNTAVGMSHLGLQPS